MTQEMKSSNQVEKEGAPSLERSGESLAIHKELMAQAARVADLWERMDMVVQAEWSVLLKGDIRNLIKVSRIKKDLVAKIVQEENMLRQLFFSLISEDHSASSLDLSTLIQRGMQGVVARRFLLYLRKREYYQRLVSVTNSRIVYWIHDRLRFCSELSNILSGVESKKSATYEPVKKSIRSFKARHDIEFQESMRSSASSVTGKIKKGMATYASQAGDRL